MAMKNKQERIRIRDNKKRRKQEVKQLKLEIMGIVIRRRLREKNTFSEDSDIKSRSWSKFYKKNGLKAT